MMALTPKRLFLSLCISISLLRSYTFFSRSPLVSKTLFDIVRETELGRTAALTRTTGRDVKGKLHSKIISSEMKDFFPKNPMVKVRGRNSNGKTVKQTAKNGRKSRVTTPRGRHESLVPGVSSSRLRPDSDQSRI